jgi:four helix bundle protein
MKIIKFEDIDAWKEARILTNRIYEITKKTAFSRDFGLRDQIQRAAVSVMSNIAEGFDSQSKADFIKFLIYARGSTSEVKSQLCVALDQGYISQEEFDKTYGEASKVARLINGFIRYLAKSK